MFVHRNRLVLVSRAALAAACLFLLLALIAYKPFFIYAGMASIAASLIADAILHHLLFRKEDALFQFVRGFILLLLVLIMLFRQLSDRV